MELQDVNRVTVTDLSEIEKILKVLVFVFATCFRGGFGPGWCA
jgi:hypothetical protein